MMFIIIDKEDGQVVSKHGTELEAKETVDFYEDMMRQAGLHKEGRFEIRTEGEEK